MGETIPTETKEINKMGFSVKQIKAILSDAGLPTDKLEETTTELCSRHATDLEAIKEERDNFKTSAEELAKTKAELDALKSNSSDSYKVKYETTKSEYDNYKKQIEQGEIKSKKQVAYKNLLNELKISPKITDRVVELADLNKIEFDDKGGIKNAEDLSKNLSEEWKDFIVTTSEKGANVSTPLTKPQEKQDLEKLPIEEYIKARKAQQEK